MQKKFVKILALALFLTPVFTQAVVLAPKNSTVPDLRPLQPIPEFVAPNYEHTVNNPAEDSASVNAEITTDESQASVQEVIMSKVKNTNWLLVVIASIVGLVFVLVAFSLKKGRREDGQ